MRKTKSIITDSKKCFFCSRVPAEKHHCLYGVANRKQSDKYGLTVFLCKEHHTGKQGVHTQRPDLDLKLKQIAQRAFERKYSREKFIAVFGKSYLIDHSNC